MSLAFVHGRIAMAVVLFTFVSGAYGLVEFFRKQPVSPSYWGVVVLGNLLALAQGALGVWMGLNGAVPGRGWIHVLYGAIAVLWIPLIRLGYRQFLKPGHARQHATLMCALVSLFEFGIALRAMATG